MTTYVYPEERWLEDILESSGELLMRYPHHRSGLMWLFTVVFMAVPGVLAYYGSVKSREGINQAVYDA